MLNKAILATLVSLTLNLTRITHRLEQRVLLAWPFQLLLVLTCSPDFLCRPWSMQMGTEV